MTPHEVDHMVTAMARLVPVNAFVGVGLGTPSALVASVLATRLRGGHVLAGGAMDVEVPIDHWFAGPDEAAGRTAGFASHFVSMEWAETQTMTMQFLRPAQVDGAGNLNTSRLGPVDDPGRRFPGGLATGDVTQLLPRVVAYLPSHQPRNTPEKASFVTGSGMPTRTGGYQNGGTAALITNLGVIEWPNAVATLVDIHPWTDVAEVVERTGFPMESEGARVTAPPSSEELMALEEIDPRRLRDRELLRQT